MKQNYGLYLKITSHCDGSERRSLARNVFQRFKNANSTVENWIEFTYLKKMKNTCIKPFNIVNIADIHAFLSNGEHLHAK